VLSLYSLVLSFSRVVAHLKATVRLVLLRTALPLPV
jgi:hypothetical protein